MIIDKAFKKMKNLQKEYLIKKAVDQGFNINEKASYGTALNMAVEQNNYDVVLLLVNNGAKVDAEDAKLKSALSSNIDPKIKQLLCDNGFKEDDESKDSYKTKTPKTELSPEEKNELKKIFDDKIKNIAKQKIFSAITTAEWNSKSFFSSDNILRAKQFVDWTMEADADINEAGVGRETDTILHKAAGACANTDLVELLIKKVLILI